MILSSTAKCENLREQRLAFIRAHQLFFDVAPIFPLPIFERFVTNIEGDCTIEASCKVESDRLIASRFLLFFEDRSSSWTNKLARVKDFFCQVECQVGVQINSKLTRQFFNDDFDFNKMAVLSAGVDLRTNLADSSLKMHILVENYPEKIAAALALSDNIEDDDLRTFLLNSSPLIGLDYYFDGRSEIEIYARLQEEDFRQPKNHVFLTKFFSKSALQPLEISSSFLAGFSRSNSSPVLYYALKNKADLQFHFRLNEVAKKAHYFYQNQEEITFFWIGVAEEELQNSQIENVRLYYQKRFAN